MNDLNIEVKYINYKANPWGVQTDYGYDDICVHNTASDASADNEWAYMNRMQPNGHPTVHYFVDDIKAIKCMPLSVDAWAISDGSGKGGNTTDIHIEICYSKSGGTKYKTAFANAMKLIAIICRDKGWSPEGRIKFHTDYGTKYCPHRSLDEFGGSASNLRSHVVSEANKILKGEEDVAKLIDNDYENAKIYDNGVEYGGKYAIEPTEAKMIRRVDPKTGKMKDTGNHVVIGRRYITDFFKKVKGSDGITRNYHYLVPRSATNTNIDVVQVDFYKED